MSPRPDDETDPDRDREEGKELATRKHPDQRRVRFAKIFDDNAEDRINDQEQPGDETVRRPEPRPDKPQNAEEDRALERGFVKLRRMTWRENAAEDVGDFGVCSNRLDDGTHRI